MSTTSKKTIPQGTRYQHNPVHRDGTRGKTQWHPDMTIAEEEAIFRVGEARSWGSDGDVFSLRVKSGGQLPEPGWLDAQGILNFAHFTGDRVWHGWPANPKRSPVDLPAYKVLQQWVTARLTTRARVAKLMRFQRCAI
jgi:hypothetical protein